MVEGERERLRKESKRCQAGKNVLFFKFDTWERFGFYVADDQERNALDKTFVITTSATVCSHTTASQAA